MEATIYAFVAKHFGTALILSIIGSCLIMASLEVATSSTSASMQKAASFGLAVSVVMTVSGGIPVLIWAVAALRAALLS